MRDISYGIVTYDPQKIGLMSITQKAVIDFLQIVGLKFSLETIECEGKKELVRNWNQLRFRKESGDIAFCGRMTDIYRKATKHLPSLGLTDGAILVTSKCIGCVVGLSYDQIARAIVSSYRVNNDLDTVTTAIFHELGHIHGIPDERRKCIGNDENSKIDDDKIVSLEHKHKGENAIFHWRGEHCLNTGCSMRQRLCFNNWKRHLTEERLPGKPYCDKCLADLKKKFKNRSDYNKAH